MFLSSNYFYGVRRHTQNTSDEGLCEVGTREQIYDGLDVVLREGRQDVVDALEHGLVVHACGKEAHSVRVLCHVFAV
jgi:hypothetical protein